MQIELNEEADEFIRRAIKKGRHKRAEDAVREALALWVERERGREELLAILDEAEVSVAQGRFRTVAAGSSQELVNAIHERGMARLAKNAKAS